MNVLAAWRALTHEVWTVTNLTSVTAETVCELLSRLAGAHPGIPITISLDNTRYQRCTLVQTVAETVAMELRSLPAYSPNVNLSERFWTCVKKPCLYLKYYPESQSFQQAIVHCTAQAPTTHKEDLEKLEAVRKVTSNKSDG